MTTNDRAAKVWKLAVSARSSSAQAGFRDGDELVGGRPASFDTFAMFIGGTDPGTVKEVELLAADSVGGPYRSRRRTCN